jgi:hypothetical protein
MQHAAQGRPTPQRQLHAFYIYDYSIERIFPLSFASCAFSIRHEQEFALAGHAQKLHVIGHEQKFPVVGCCDLVGSPCLSYVVNVSRHRCAKHATRIVGWTLGVDARLCRNAPALYQDRALPPWILHPDGGFIGLSLPLHDSIVRRGKIFSGASCRKDLARPIDGQLPFHDTHPTPDIPRASPTASPLRAHT